MRGRKVILVAPPVNERSEDPNLWEIVIPTAWMEVMENTDEKKPFETYPGEYNHISWEGIVNYMCDPNDYDYPFLDDDEYEKWEKKMNELGIWTPDLREVDEIGSMSTRIEELKSRFGFDKDWVVVYDRNSFIKRDGGEAILGEDKNIGRYEMLKVDGDESIKIEFVNEKNDLDKQWEGTNIYISKGLYYIRKHKIINSGDCINFSKEKISDLLQTK